MAEVCRSLNPDPPDLKEIAHEREPAQLLWVVKNGIKMTGMPSFGAIGATDPEIWSIVAFIRKCRIHRRMTSKHGVRIHRRCFSAPRFTREQLPHASRNRALSPVRYEARRGVFAPGFFTPEIKRPP